MMRHFFSTRSSLVRSFQKPLFLLHEALVEFVQLFNTFAFSDRQPSLPKGPNGFRTHTSTCVTPVYRGPLITGGALLRIRDIIGWQIAADNILRVATQYYYLLLPAMHSCIATLVPEFLPAQPSTPQPARRHSLGE